MSQSITYRKFRVIDNNGEFSHVEPFPCEKAPLWAENLSQEELNWHKAGESPFFEAPIPFVIPPAAGSGEPFYKHNHCPAITWCPNGDLLAVWFSTEQETGTEMTILASRLRTGSTTWDAASEFFKASDRNMTGSALFNDRRGTLYHFNGMGLEGVIGWEKLTILMRTSSDNGLTWTPARAISSNLYQRRHQVIAGTSATPDGTLIQACDATPGGEGPTAIHVSSDGGNTWSDPGGDIRGIHAGVVGLTDGRLLAFGRAQHIEGRMPISISSDMGKTWSYSASPFPPISSGQRLILMRLHEGPLMFVSFTDASHKVPSETWSGMEFRDAQGGAFTGYGMFAAVSTDEGQTWPIRKLLTPGTGEYDGGAWTGKFAASPTHAEHKGYLAATQTPDRTIHLISSRLHYRFNLGWLMG